MESHYLDTHSTWFDDFRDPFSVWWIFVETSKTRIKTGGHAISGSISEKVVDTILLNCSM